MKAFRFFLLLIAVALLSSCSAARKAKADKDTMVWRYEIEPTGGQAVQGSILVKVWSYSKGKIVARNQAGKNAIHGILFKGVSALNRIPAQKPMIVEPDAEAKYADYLEDFFSDGGKYMKFVNFVNNGVPAPGDIIKIKNEYKIGVTVSIAKDALRKELENSGIVRPLGAGF